VFVPCSSLNYKYQLLFNLFIKFLTRM